MCSIASTFGGCATTCETSGGGGSSCCGGAFGCSSCPTNCLSSTSCSTLMWFACVIASSCDGDEIGAYDLHTQRRFFNKTGRGPPFCADKITIPHLNCSSYWPNRWTTSHCCSSRWSCYCCYCYCCCCCCSSYKRWAVRSARASFASRSSSCSRKCRQSWRDDE